MLNALSVLTQGVFITRYADKGARTQGMPVVRFLLGGKDGKKKRFIEKNCIFRSKKALSNWKRLFFAPGIGIPLQRHLLHVFLQLGCI
jgi:hypothetical protein